MIIFLVSFLHFLNISLLLTRHLAWRKKLNKFIAFMPCTEWAKANKCEAFKCKNVRKHIMLCIVVYWQKVQRGDEPRWTYNNDNSNNINMEQKLKAYTLVYTHTIEYEKKRQILLFSSHQFLLLAIDFLRVFVSCLSFLDSPLLLILCAIVYFEKI